MLLGILYPISIPSVDHTLIKRNAECRSEGEFLGKFTSLDECANACRRKNECAFFIYGIENKMGKCWWEKTSGAGCPEGWETDNFDFYELNRGTVLLSNY